MDQEITLVLPRETAGIQSDAEILADGASAGGRNVTPPAGKKITLVIRLK